MTDFTRWFANISSNKEAQKWAAQSEDRHTRAYQEMLSGYAVTPEDLLLTVDKVTQHQGLVSMKGIRFSSVCKHHLLPFVGTLDLVYEPGKGLFGAGKLPRVVDAHARRLQLQEDICRDVAKTLVKAGARGAFVRATAIHTCIVCRGPRAHDATLVTTHILGSLEKNKEALNLIL